MVNAKGGSAPRVIDVAEIPIRASLFELSNAGQKLERVQLRNDNRTSRAKTETV